MDKLFIQSIEWIRSRIYWYQSLLGNGNASACFPKWRRLRVWISSRASLFIQYHYKLKSRYDRLRERGMLTQSEIAAMLGISIQTVRRWRKRGLLRGYEHNSKKECLYEHPGKNPPVKRLGQKLSERRKFNEVDCNRDSEVQYEAWLLSISSCGSSVYRISDSHNWFEA